jgi:hypothetical protein
VTGRVAVPGVARMLVVMMLITAVCVKYLFSIGSFKLLLGWNMNLGTPRPRYVLSPGESPCQSITSNRPSSGSPFKRGVSDSPCRERAFIYHRSHVYNRTIMETK